MDFLNTQLMIETLIYVVVFLLCGLVVWLYLRFQSQKSAKTAQKIEIAKIEGRFEPISLHPYIDLNTCIGSGACVSACPEKDILGIVNGKASIINATSCVGHGACFHACPVEAISLRIGTETRGVELPHVNQNFESNVPGIFIAGELGGMGLIKNSIEQGRQALKSIVEYIRQSKHKNATYDLVIIGAGPAGISAALHAKEAGLNFLIVDQYTLGGTVYSFPRNKIVMTSPSYLPYYGPIKLYNTSKDELLSIWNSALTKAEITVKENTKIEFVVSLDGMFEVLSASGEKFLASSVLIAIGRRGTPRKLGVKGEDLPKVFYRLLEPEYIFNKKIVVVGGGDSAVESAMLLMDQNDVILSYRGSRFSRIKPKNEERIQKAYQEGKVKIIFNSNIKEIKPNHVVIKIAEDKEEEIPNDFVYIFAGGELPTKFLREAGIEITKRFGYIVKSHKKK